VSARDEFLAGLAKAGGQLPDAPENQRRIYVDGQGNGWIDLAADPVTGDLDLAGISDPWKVVSADKVRADTGGLTEIGRCW
jgi:hypothetical protein